MSMIISGSSSASTAPTVTSQSGSWDAINVSVTMNGNVTDDGGDTITERGFYWDIDDSTITPFSTKETVSGTTGSFSHEEFVTQTSSDQTLYYRSYAKNSIGETLSSTTQSVTIPGTGI